MIKLSKILEIESVPGEEVEKTYRLCRITIKNIQGKPNLLAMWAKVFKDFDWDSFGDSIQGQLERLKREGKIKTFYDRIMEIYKESTKVNE